MRLVITYHFVEPGQIFFDKKSRGIVHDLYCEKHGEDVRGILIGTIVGDIINQEPSLRDPQNPTLPMRQLTKDEIPKLLKHLSVEIGVSRKGEQSPFPTQMVEIVITNFEIKEGTEPIVNFIDKVQCYYLKNFQFKAKIEEKE